MLLKAFTFISLAITAFAAPAPTKTFGPVTIFSPPADYIVPRTLYARSVLLDNGDLLATWENYSPEPQNNSVYFPIYKSSDHGKSWKHISNVTDQVNGWGLRYQPFLYELPQAIGNYSAGTILLAGNSIPTTLSNTQIDIYASTDKGKNWKFVSHVAAGGEALPNNGLTPVWEPFLMVYQNQLVVYYSDQRDPKYGQKLVHQVTSDLQTYGPVVNDVAYPTYDWRPGMTTISLLPNGKYFLTYEFYGAIEADFAVYYRISDSPLTFDSAPGQVLRPINGSVPTSSPYNVWTSAGNKENGTIVVSSASQGSVFLNTQLGAPEAWTALATPEQASYSGSLKVLKNPERVLVIRAGPLGGSNNTVTDSVIVIPKDKKKN